MDNVTQQAKSEQAVTAYNEFRDGVLKCNDLQATLEALGPFTGVAMSNRYEESLPFALFSSDDEAKKFIRQFAKNDLVGCDGLFTYPVENISLDEFPNGMDDFDMAKAVERFKDIILKDVRAPEKDDISAKKRVAKARKLF
jgi:hypothetical protein